jgi:2Fe-2S ferredoxin
MAIISFARKRQPLQVPDGSILMECLVDAGIPVATSCGGSGVCTKCCIQILAGAENLSAPNDLEEFLREVNNFAADMRVSCQTTVHGDITVDASYW